MPSKKKSIAISDVAKKAGVSVATVSRVLNDSDLVKPETKSYILEVAAQMGYSLPARRPGPRPGTPARKKRVAFLNFIDSHHVDSDMHLTFIALQNGVKEGGRSAGLAVDVQFVGTDEPLSEALTEQKYAGFVLQGHRPHPSVEEFLRTQPCCWVTNNPWTPTWGDHVMLDHREAGMMAAEYLVDHKCRKLVVVKLGMADRVSALREEGFAYAAAKHGVESFSVVAKGPLPDAPEVYPEAIYVDEIIDGCKALPDFIDGIFFDSDRAMTTLYPAMVKEKVIHPGKTVLIGCNNQQVYLKGITPHPATMDAHFEQIGVVGVSQLAWRIKHPDFQRHRTLISPKLIALQ